MAVSKTVAFVNVGGTLYVPHRGVSRFGIVGTYSFRVTETGDATGGGVDIILQMKGDELGFPALVVPTIIAARDNLATAENVKFSHLANNDRLASNYERRIDMVLADDLNLGELVGTYIPSERDAPATASMWQWSWASNVDTKTYAASLFAVVYDRQAMSKAHDLQLVGPLAGPL